jgi:molecular chaperone GrpE
MGKSDRGKSRQGDSVLGLNLRQASDNLEAPKSENEAAESQPAEASVNEAGSSDALAAIEKERNEYYELLLRKQAEFENFRKRTAREREDTRTMIRAEIIGELLPIVDASEKGLEAMKAQDVPDGCLTFLEGYELLLRQLQSFLERFEVTPVPGVGSTFDPNVHEAVLREMSREFGENEVVEEYRKGYLIGDRLLRPSQVKVAVWPEEAE